MFHFDRFRMGDSPGRLEPDQQSGRGVAGFPAGRKISCLVPGSSHAPPRVRRKLNVLEFCGTSRTPRLPPNLGPGDPRLTQWRAQAQHFSAGLASLKQLK